MIHLLFFGLLAATQSQQQTIEQVAVAGVSTNIEIPCTVGRQDETPFWYINGSVYELFGIPRSFLPGITPAVIPVVDSYSALQLPMVIVELDRTLFQCAVFNENGRVLGVATRLNVRVNVENPPINGSGSNTSLTNGLALIYEDLEIQQNMATLKWATQSCSSLYELQGYTLAKITTNNLESVEPDAVFRINNSDTAVIPSTNFTTTSGDTLHYRLVALSDDSTVCSHQETKMTFYRFDTSPAIETTIASPNTRLCYNIPSTDICPYGIRFLWPRARSEFSCSCPVHNSSDGNTVFGDCISCESEITPQSMANGSICFSAPSNELVVHFECLDNELCIFECSGDERCIEGECFIRTLLKSHKVIAPDSTISDTTAPSGTQSTDPEAPSCPDVPGSLYFELEGVRYESGFTLLITELGTSTSSVSVYFPESSLVCVTSEVNPWCCRKRDGANVGEWHFPNGTIVPRNRHSGGSDFTRTGYKHQVRLNRMNDAMEPLGTYKCVVPREDGCGDMMHIANITIIGS